MCIALWLCKLMDKNCIGEMKDALETQGSKMEMTLHFDVYEQVIQHLLVHQKMQRIQKKLKKDVEIRIPGKQPFPTSLE